MNNIINNCLKCNQLKETINRLKSQNIDLKDQLLINKQQNIALNNIRIDSIKCIDVLNKIVDKLTIRYENNSRVDENKEEINALKCDYEKSFDDLNLWFKQIDVLKTINKFVTIKCTPYEDKPQIRRSNRISQPVGHFTPFPQINIKIEKNSFNKCEETPTSSTSKSKSNNGSESQRLRCPFPKCGFSTRRGVIGLKEHSTCHKRNINDDNETKPLVPMEEKCLPSKEKKSKKGQLLRCSYPDCNYTTHWGMYSIRRHLKSIHTKKSTPNKSNTNNNNNSLNSNSSKIAIDMKKLSKNNSNSNSKPLLRCSYANCDYETRYGMNKLRYHMKVHTNERQIKSKTHKNKSENVLNINSHVRRLGALLRCTKCQYKTKWGLGTLKKHMKIHNREKPFKCDQCDASYAQRYPLQQHKQLMHKQIIHLNKNDHKIIKNTNVCNVCNKSFRNSYGLKRHQKTHSSTDSSYECPHENCFFKTHIPEIFQKHVVTHVLTEDERIDRSAVKVEPNQSLDSNSIESLNGLEVIKIKLEDSSDEEQECELVPIEIPEEIPEMINESNASNSRNGDLFNYGSHLIQNSLNKSNAKGRKSTRSQNLNNKNEDQSETPLTNRLMQSLLKTSVSPQYSCDAPNCSFTSNEAQLWIEHNDSHENKVYKCNRCKKSYPKQSKLEAHQRLKNHHIFYYCLYPNCSQKFQTQQSLTKHNNEVHKNRSIFETPVVSQVTFKCNYFDCKKSFAKDKYLKKHMRNVHNIRKLAKKSTTNIINQSNGSNDETEANVSTFTSTDIKCAAIICCQTFESMSLMIQHFNKNHKQFDGNSVLIESLFASSQCSNCGLLFANQANMRRHKSLAHKQINSHTISNSMNQTFGSTQSYLCQRSGCGKWFDSAISLRQHLNLEHNKNISSANNSIYESVSDQSLIHSQQDEEMPSIDTDFDNSLPFYDSLYLNTNQTIPSSEQTQTQTQTQTLEQIDENVSNFNNLLTSIKVEQI